MLLSLFQVAIRGSILFFSVLSLYHLDQVYTFSSLWFTELFKNCIQSIQSPSEDVSFDLYLDEIVEYLTISVFQSVTSGILTKHCLPFSFKLCTMLFLHNDPSLTSPTSIALHEWMTLLKNTSLLEAVLSSTSTPLGHNKTRRVKPDVIPAEVWESAKLLSKMLPDFHDLLLHIVNNADLWVQFMHSPAPWSFHYEAVEVVRIEDPKSSSSPSGSNPFSLKKMNRFQRLLLVNAFCLERLAAAVKWFVDSEMGATYTSKSLCGLNTAFRGMTHLKPVLIIITPSEYTHTDPTCSVVWCGNSQPRQTRPMFTNSLIAITLMTDIIWSLH